MPRDLAGSLWAMANLNVQYPAFVKHIHQMLLTDVSRLTLLHLADLLWASAMMNHTLTSNMLDAYWVSVLHSILLMSGM